MNNADYWKQRFEQLEHAQNTIGRKLLLEIEKQYNDAREQLEAKIIVWYQRLAANNEISMAEARGWLESNERREFKWTVQEYIKYGKENALNQKWLKELENSSAKYHISKLEAIKIQTRQVFEALYAKQQEAMRKAFSDIYRSGYYHTAYEIQNGFHIGWDIARVNQSKIEKVLSKPWAADGYNFSERIWNNKQRLISEIHNELSQNILIGADPQKAIDSLAKKMNTSKNNAGRLVMTEEAYFSSAAQKDCFEELGVEQYEIVATLDSHTSDICRNLDGKHFPMKDYQAGVTAPPFHVYCRSTTVPYFDEQFDIGERAARDRDGNTYYIPADINYREWEKTFVKDSSGSVDKLDENGIIEEKRNAALEQQRYGRNKNTVVNKTYIESGEYRRKFDNVTDNKKVNKTLYNCAKKALKHRSGTACEDMYWIDSDTGKIIADEITGNYERKIKYSSKTKKIVDSYKKERLITIHTHPSSMPPSVGDLNSCNRNSYKLGIIACHDGKVFAYTSKKYINENLYNMYISSFISEGFSEYESQLKALDELMKNHDVSYWEVK